MKKLIAIVSILINLIFPPFHIKAKQYFFEFNPHSYYNYGDNIHGIETVRLAGVTTKLNDDLTLVHYNEGEPSSAGAPIMTYNWSTLTSVISIYPKTYMVLSVPEGKVITSMYIPCSKTDKLKVNDVNINSNTWDGITSSIKISGPSYFTNEYYENVVGINGFSVIYEDFVPVSDIVIDKDTLRLQEGTNYKLKATRYPSNATVRKIQWESSDPAIATVNGGTVKGLSKGEATITAKCGDCSVSCVVKVFDETNWKIEGIENVIIGDADDHRSMAEKTEGGAYFQGSDIVLRMETCPKFKVVQIEETDTVPEVSCSIDWSFSKDKNSYFYVAQSRIEDDIITIIPKEIGDTKYSIYMVGLNQIQSGTIKVLPKNPVHSIECIPKELNMGVGTTTFLKGSILPEDADYNKIEWKSDNPSVVSIIDETIDGIAIKALSPGVVNITASTMDGTDLISTCSINVENSSYLVTEDFIHSGDWFPSYDNIPLDETEFTSSNTGITYSIKGCYWLSNHGILINGKKYEKAAISFTLPEQCEQIDVVTTSSCSTNSNSMICLYVDDNYIGSYCVNEHSKLYELIIPIEYRRKGSRIKIESGTNYYNQQFTAFNYHLTTPIDLNRDRIVLYQGSEFSLQASKKGFPMSAVDLNWSSFNEDVATVDQNGRVIAGGPGETTISVSSDGHDIGLCQVKVLGCKDWVLKGVENYLYDDEEDKRSMTEKTETGTCIVGENFFIRPNAYSIIKLELSESVEENSNFHLPEMEWNICQGDALSTRLEHLENSSAFKLYFETPGKIDYWISIGDSIGKEGTITVLPHDPISSLLLHPEEVNLQLYTSPAVLTPVGQPNDSMIPELIWESSDESVAKVNNKGGVLPVGIGKCMISAHTTDGTCVAASSTVNIVGRSDHKFEINENLNKTTLYNLSDSEKMSFYSNETGLIYELNSGELLDNYIYLTEGNHYDEYISVILPDICEQVDLIMMYGSRAYFHVDDYWGINYNYERKGDRVYYKVVIPQEYRKKSMKFDVKTFNDAEVVSLIYHFINDNMRMSDEELNMEIGAEHQLTTSLSAQDTADDPIVWESSNPEIVSVSESGLLRAHSNGTAHITASCDHSQALCVVKVDMPSSVELTPMFPNRLIDVYNMQGILIKRKMGLDDLKTLPHGIYIVNGKKIKL